MPAGSGSGAGPIRTCVGCRQRHPQQQLARFVADTQGCLIQDRGHPGRGAWLCRDQPTCWDSACRRNAWTRALRRRVQAGEAPTGWR
ncbi:MAG: YlxR family protein [Acidimicrobiales bacterium]